jgi:hypothetical protein
MGMRRRQARGRVSGGAAGTQRARAQARRQSTSTRHRHPALALWLATWALCLTPGSLFSLGPFQLRARLSALTSQTSACAAAPGAASRAGCTWHVGLGRHMSTARAWLPAQWLGPCAGAKSGAGCPGFFASSRLTETRALRDGGAGETSALHDGGAGSRNWSVQHRLGSTVGHQTLGGEKGDRQGSGGGRQGSGGGLARRQGQSGSGMMRGEEKRGIAHAKSGQPVEVKYDDDWRPAVIVGLTRPTAVVVQYVGGNEHCRETIDMRSERLRALEVKGSDTIMRLREMRRDDVASQLEWCAQIARSAGRSSSSVPLVASQSAIGWQRRREVENWVGSWSLPGRADAGGFEGRIRVGQLPRDLASLSSLVDLLDALEEALEASPGDFGAKQGVIAMNHIKRLAWQCQQDDLALKQRTKETMRHFAEAAAKGMDRLSSKDVALLLNAVTSVLDVRSECPGLRTKTADSITASSSIATNSDAHAGEQVGEHSRESCVFWGMFDKASQRLLRLDTLFTAHAMAGVADVDNPGKFTSQGVAMVANALSHAGIRDEPLLQMLSRVVLHQLTPREYTAQSVSLIAAAFDRLSFKDSAVFARLAHVAVAIPARSYDGQALSVLLWSLSRHGDLCEDTQLMAMTAAAVRRMPVRKWNMQHMCRALQTISSAHAKMTRSAHESKAPWDDVDASAKALHVDETACALFGYAAQHIASGALRFDGKTTPTQMAVLAAECVKAADTGWLSAAERDDVLRRIRDAVTFLARACVHAFSHNDVAVLMAALLRARLSEDVRKDASRSSLAPDVGSGKCPVSHPGSANGGEGGARGNSGVWAAMMHVLTELPEQRASARDLVKLLESIARAGEAGLLLGGRTRLRSHHSHT